MQRDGDRLVYSASDVTNFVECAHLTEIDRRIVLGELAWERSRSLDVEILARYGIAHEAAYLDRLVAGGAEIVQIETRPGVSAMRRAVAETRSAMRSGASVIYQAALMNDRFGGYADFLMRVERPSALGEWAYEPLDTKLARRVRPYFLVQLCFYAGLIAELQGAPPEHVRVLLGSGEEASYRLADFSAYYRAVERRFVRNMAEPGRSTYPEPVEHCPVCRWSEHCQAQRVADDHLSLVAWMHREQAARLRMAGIQTLADLGRSGEGTRIPRMAQPTFATLRSQASLQLAERESGVPSIEILPPKPERGFAQLPEPDEGDIFFDMEGDPYIEGGLEYLFGVCFRTDGELRFRAFWAHSRAEERHAFEQLIDFICERRVAYPRMHVYHYASYEKTALRRLMGLHATRESDVDDLMRGEVLVDLFQIVRQALRISKPSYSIKELEAFYMDGRNAAVKDAGGSIVAYEEWAQNHDAVVLEGIERYNEEDCRSTALLLEWLHQRRLDAMRRFGEDIPWREPPEPRVPDPSDHSDEAERVSRDLLAGLPEDVSELSDEQRARYLLGHVLSYHRREAKPTWWWYFDRRKQTGEALIDDHESIGGLEPTGTPIPDKKSRIDMFTFPAQQHKLVPGQRVVGSDNGARYTLDCLDEERGQLALRVGPKYAESDPPGAIIPGGPYDTDAHEAALLRLGKAVLAGKPDYAGLRRLLARDLPQIHGLVPGSPIVAGSPELTDVSDRARRLVESPLFIQGPPGSGKTWMGARIIVDLLESGKRVGISGPSHKSIHNLLREIESAARCRGVRVEGVKKASGDESSYESVTDPPMITNRYSNDDFPPDEATLVAGTAWLFADQILDGWLDYLVIDEAGQISLADALAMGTSSRNMILLGDPLQLPHVSHGTHPPGVACSVLEHLLGSAGTLPPERGIFLDQTRRMHPDVCRFISEVIYEDRLSAIDDCARQTVTSPGLTGTGLRHIAADHFANTRSSPEEAALIAREITQLAQGTVTEKDGASRPIGEGDVMVVTPYNAQVRMLRAALPDWVRVGTVDKFQGQEAAVVFFSMATSSGEDAPRNVDFLYSRNRLNVAVSRAKCLAVLVCNPALLHIRCHTTEQVRLVNALCRFAELALPLHSPFGVSRRGLGRSQEPGPPTLN